MRLRSLFVAAVLLTGCAAQDTYTGLTVSGQTLLATANSFNSTAANVYLPNCLPTPRTGYQTFCGKFQTFTAKYDQAFPAAYRAWQIAVAANDTAKAKGAEATIIQLTAELAALTAELVGGK